MTHEAGAGGRLVPFPRPGGRPRRRPATGAEQARRVAFGKTWSAIGRKVGELVRSEDKPT